MTIDAINFFKFVLITICNKAKEFHTAPRLFKDNYYVADFLLSNSYAPIRR